MNYILELFNKVNFDKFRLTSLSAVAVAGLTGILTFMVFTSILFALVLPSPAVPMLWSAFASIAFYLAGLPAFKYMVIYHDWELGNDDAGSTWLFWLGSVATLVGSTILLILTAVKGISAGYAILPGVIFFTLFWLIVIFTWVYQHGENIFKDEDASE